MKNLWKKTHNFYVKLSCDKPRNEAKVETGLGLILVFMLNALL